MIVITWILNWTLNTLGIAFFFLWKHSDRLMNHLMNHIWRQVVAVSAATAVTARVTAASPAALQTPPAPQLHVRHQNF